MTDLFTATDVEELIVAAAKRAKLDDFILDRLDAWKAIVGGEPLLEEGAYVRDLRTEVDTDTLYDLDQADLTVRFHYHDAYDGRGKYETETFPKAFIFDSDGLYEKKLRAVKALEAELELLRTTH